MTKGSELCCVFLVFVLSVAAGLAQSTSGGPGSGSTSGGPGSGGGSSNAAQISFHIPDETVPPDGIAQMKVMETEPTPVSTGRTGFAVASGVSVRGIQLFNPNGDVQGVAMIEPLMISIQSVFSTGTGGTDYPIMVVSLQVPPETSPGTSFPFSLDPSSAWILGPLGTATMKPISPAMIEVAGSISITDVVPGGGLQPAGSVVHVQGFGFEPQTQVQLSNIKFSSITVASSQDIQIVLAEPTDMTGKKVQVTNPDGSQDTYFSYMRGTPLGSSSVPLLASAVPIFSSTTYSQAVFATAAASASQFDGIAVQNPNLAPATATFTLFSSSNIPLGTSTTVIPSGYRFMRGMSELAGMVPPEGSYMLVSSDVSVQLLGFLGDNLSGTVVPCAALSSQP